MDDRPGLNTGETRSSMARQDTLVPQAVSLTSFPDPVNFVEAVKETPVVGDIGLLQVTKPTVGDYGNDNPTSRPDNGYQEPTPGHGVPDLPMPDYEYQRNRIPTQPVSGRDNHINARPDNGYQEPPWHGVPNQPIPDRNFIPTQPDSGRNNPINARPDDGRNNPINARPDDGQDNPTSRPVEGHDEQLAPLRHPNNTSDTRAETFGVDDTRTSAPKTFQDAMRAFNSKLGTPFLLERALNIVKPMIDAKNDWNDVVDVINLLPNKDGNGAATIKTTITKIKENIVELKGFLIWFAERNVITILTPNEPLAKEFDALVDIVIEQLSSSQHSTEIKKELGALASSISNISGIWKPDTDYRKYPSLLKFVRSIDWMQAVTTNENKLPVLSKVLNFVKEKQQRRNAEKQSRASTAVSNDRTPAGVEITDAQNRNLVLERTINTTPANAEASIVPGSQPVGVDNTRATTDDVGINVAVDALQKKLHFETGEMRTETETFVKIAVSLTYRIVNKQAVYKNYVNWQQVAEVINRLPDTTTIQKQLDVPLEFREQFTIETSHCVHDAYAQPPKNIPLCLLDLFKNNHALLEEVVGMLRNAKEVFDSLPDQQNKENILSEFTAFMKSVFCYTMDFERYDPIRNQDGAARQAKWEGNEKLELKNFKHLMDFMGLSFWGKYVNSTQALKALFADLVPNNDQHPRDARIDDVNGCDSYGLTPIHSIEQKLSEDLAMKTFPTYTGQSLIDAKRDALDSIKSSKSKWEHEYVGKTFSEECKQKAKENLEYIQAQCDKAIKSLEDEIERLTNANKTVNSIKQADLNKDPELAMAYDDAAKRGGGFACEAWVVLLVAALVRLTVLFALRFGESVRQAKRRAVIRTLTIDLGVGVSVVMLAAAQGALRGQELQRAGGALIVGWLLSCGATIAIMSARGPMEIGDCVVARLAYGACLGVSLGAAAFS